MLASGGKNGYLVPMENDTPIEKKEHWRLVVLMIVVQLLDVAVARKLCSGGELSPAGAAVVQTFHYGSNFLLLLLLFIIVLSALRPHSRLVLPGLTIYLGFALLHLVVNVGALLLSATGKATGLASLWDVGAIGVMSVITFAVSYWILDRATPGRAFIIPGRGGPIEDPRIFDYIYLSFDTCTTFGPTIETPVSRGAKALMMLQVVLSVLVLTVLLSRAVNAIG